MTNNDKELQERSETLLKVVHDMLKEQTDSRYVISMLEQTSTWDNAECDGMCLMTDIGEHLEIIQETKRSMGSVDKVDDRVTYNGIGYIIYNEVGENKDTWLLCPDGETDEINFIEVNKSELHYQPPKSDPVARDRTNIDLLEKFVDSCINRKLFNFEEAEDLLKKLVPQSPKSEPVDLENAIFNQSITLDRKDIVKRVIGLKRNDHFSFELNDGTFFHNKKFYAISGQISKCYLAYENEDGSEGKIDDVNDVQYIVRLSQPPKSEPVDFDGVEMYPLSMLRSAYQKGIKFGNSIFGCSKEKRGSLIDESLDNESIIKYILSQSPSREEWKVKGKNSFGLDCGYYSKELFSLNETLHCRTPEEMKRYFLVLADSVYIPPQTKSEDQS